VREGWRRKGRERRWDGGRGRERGRRERGRKICLHKQSKKWWIQNVYREAKKGEPVKKGLRGLVTRIFNKLKNLGQRGDWGRPAGGPAAGRKKSTEKTFLGKIGGPSEGPVGAASPHGTGRV